MKVPAHDQMKIYICYKHTDEPWGGVNSFVRAFRVFCISKDIKLANSINAECDVILITSPYRDRARLVNLKEIVNLKNIGTTNKFMHFFLRQSPKILIYRCDGFRDEYAGLANDPGDAAQKAILNIADHIVFQNDFCLRSARRMHIGYTKDNFSIIYNGVNQNLFCLKEDYWDGIHKIRFFSSSWSVNPNKGFRTMAEFSELKDVDVTFCGRWPAGADHKNVTLLPPMPQEDLAKEFMRHHVFLHPAKYDPSPNVCLEAISCGLPIAYHPTSGIKEVAGDCGVEIDERNLQKTLDEIKTRYLSLVETVRRKREFYSIERCGGEYLKMFEKLLTQPK